MDKYESFEVIKKQLCKEIDQIAEQIQKNQQMSTQELDKLDKMFHLKKSLLTCQAMEESEEYENGGYNQNGNSGYRGRALNGRFVSRDANQSYEDGYSHGYSEAMSQMSNRNSGHYSPMISDPPRRW